MSLVEKPLAVVLSEIASESPAPGGGSAAALAGATAAALCDMVCGLTIGREKYRPAWAELEEARAAARRLGGRLAALVEEDAQAYLDVMAARKLPRATGEERGLRARALQGAVLRAAKVPLETLESVALLARVAARAADKGNPACITDAGSAAALIRAGAMAAAWNVRVNLPLLPDGEERQELAAAALKALDETLETVSRVESLVDARLGERRDA